MFLASTLSVVGGIPAGRSRRLRRRGCPRRSRGAHV